MNYSNYSVEQLMERIEELEMLSSELLKEKEQESSLRQLVCLPSRRLLAEDAKVMIIDFIHWQKLIGGRKFPPSNLYLSICMRYNKAVLFISVCYTTRFRSSAICRFTFNTLTISSPNMPRTFPCVFSFTISFNLSCDKPVASANAGI